MGFFGTRSDRALGALEHLISTCPSIRASVTKTYQVHLVYQVCCSYSYKTLWLHLWTTVGWLDSKQNSHLRPKKQQLVIIYSEDESHPFPLFFHKVCCADEHKPFDFFRPPGNAVRWIHTHWHATRSWEGGCPRMPRKGRAKEDNTNVQDASIESFLVNSSTDISCSTSHYSSKVKTRQAISEMS